MLPAGMTAEICAGASSTASQRFTHILRCLRESSQRDARSRQGADGGMSVWVRQHQSGLELDIVARAVCGRGPQAPGSHTRPRPGCRARCRRHLVRASRTCCRPSALSPRGSDSGRASVETAMPFRIPRTDRRSGPPGHRSRALDPGRPSTRPVLQLVATGRPIPGLGENTSREGRQSGQETRRSG